MSALRRKEKIGELLLRTGLVTSEQLQQALTAQVNQEKGKTLGQILLGLGYVNKDDLNFALSIQSGFTYIQIKHCKMQPDVLSLLSEDEVRKYQVFPIDKIQDFLTIAMANPLDQIVINEIKNLTKSNVLVFLTTPQELEEMISIYYGKK